MHAKIGSVSPMKHIPLRLWAFANDFLVFCSSAIVTGIISYFLHNYSYRGVHVVYQEVIATITLAVYTFAMVLPVLGDYRGQLAPFNFIFSYLWLTSFIFAAQDWTGGRCSRGDYTSSCSLEKTVVAFDFVALFFLMCNVASEGAFWHAWRADHGSKGDIQHKESTASATTNGTGPLDGGEEHTATSA